MITAACGGAAPLDQGSDDLATGLSFYATVSCTNAAQTSACSSFSLHAVNQSQKAIRAAAIDFTSNGMPAVGSQFAAASPTEFLLHGWMSDMPVNGARKFVVDAAFRGLPGMTVASGDEWMGVTQRQPAIQCITAPCNNLVCSGLNQSGPEYATTLQVAPAAAPRVDTAFLADQLLAHGAMAAAHMENGQSYPGGPEVVVTTSQIYLQLPVRTSVCPAYGLKQCPQGQVMTFTRNADLCKVPAGCVTPGICPMYVPACEAGYTLQSWPAGPNGCPAWACDPAFVH